MTFWGLELKPCESFAVEPEYPLHVTQAALGVGGDSEMRNVLQVQCDGQTFVLGSLRYGSVEQLHLDLVFEPHKKLTFFVSGPGDVHLTGFFITTFVEQEEAEAEAEAEAEEEEEAAEEEGDSGSQLLKMLIAGEDIGDDDDGEEFVPDEEELGDLTIEDDADVDAPQEEEEEEVTTKVKEKKRSVRFEVPVEQPKKPKQRMSLAEEVVGEEETAEEGERPKKKKKRATSIGSAEQQHHQDVEEEEEETTTTEPAAATAAAPAPKPVTPVEGRQATPFPTRPHNPAAAAIVQQQKQQSQQQQQPKSGSAVEAIGDNAKPKKLRDGLIVQDVMLGTGPRPAQGKRVYVKYVGRLSSNGTIFDKTSGKPFSFRLGLGEVIRGWDIGVAGMRIGGKRKLIIPPNLAYGPKGAAPDIPPNATLLFDIELVGAQA